MRFDLRLAWRALRRQPAISVAVMLTVGLAVAANTALFSVFDGMMFRPLPFRDADRIVHVDVAPETRRAMPADELRGALAALAASPLFDRRAMAGPFVAIEEGAAGVAAWHLRPAAVSAEWFALLGVRPLAGRDLFDGQDPDRVVIGEALWREHYGGDASLIGTPIDLPGMPFKRRPILWGVMPASFSLPDGANAWFPGPWPPGSFNYARLRDGVTVDQVRTAFPAADVTPLGEYVRPNGSYALAVLLGATGLLLLVAWVQVAALLFSRAVARAGEIGVRLALGASRIRVIRQFAAEGFLIAAGALAIAVAVAGPLTAGVVRLLPEELTRGQALNLDGRAVGFAALTSLVGVLLLALVPIDLIRRSHPLALLRGTVFGSVRAGAARTRGLMLIAQLAVTVVLIYMSGLAVRSASRVTHVDLGFTPDRLVALRMPAVTTRGPDGLSIRDHLALQAQRAVQLFEAIGAMTGVDTVAYGAVPFYRSAVLSSPVWPVSLPGLGDVGMASGDTVSLTYPRALGLSVVAGHVPAESELAADPNLALVNEALARRLRAYGPVVGRTITIAGRTLTVAGIVHDFVTDRADRPASPAVLRLTQEMRAQPPYLLVRLEDSEAGDRAVAGVRAAFDRIWTDNPSRELVVVSDLASRAVADYRARATMLVLIGVLCLPLAVIGVGGALSFAVARERHDIAIRLALGADRRDVQLGIVRRALIAGAFGLGLGVVAGIVAGRLMSASLFGVRPADPATIAWVAVALVSVVGFGAWMPARQASSIRPAEALREGMRT